MKKLLKVNHALWIKVSTHEGTSPCNKFNEEFTDEGTDRKDLSHEQFARSVLRNKSQGIVLKIQNSRIRGTGHREQSD